MPGEFQVSGSGQRGRNSGKILGMWDGNVGKGRDLGVGIFMEIFGGQIGKKTKIFWDRIPKIPQKIEGYGSGNFPMDSLGSNLKDLKNLLRSNPKNSPKKRRNWEWRFFGAQIPKIPNKMEGFGN